MVVWIDGKNPALYSSGISSWLKCVLMHLDEKELQRSVLITPRISSRQIYPGLNIDRLTLPWIGFVPRKLNHLLYDNFTFKLHSLISRPEVFFSPYFDIFPANEVKSVITVHDVCFLEFPELYPTFQKRYYLSKLRRNILKASKVVTVSETSKKSILNFFEIREEDILVVPNVLSDEFAFYVPSDFEIQTFKSRFKQDVPLILYTSGHDRRKNLERLISALAKLHSNGVDFAFLVTGDSRSRLSELLNAMPVVKDKTYFLGYLTEQELKTAYLSSNVVVFPSLNEGFGRACLESMSTGTPLACSRIPIFQEIAQNYAFYFSPFDSNEMATVLQRAIKSDRKQSIQPAELSDSEGFKALREYLFGGSGQL